MVLVKNNYRQIISYINIILVAILLALNYHIFIVENHFAPAGLNGIATMVQYKTGFSISYMSLIINIPLCHNFVHFCNLRLKCGYAAAHVSPIRLKL